MNLAFSPFNLKFRVPGTELRYRRQALSMVVPLTRVATTLLILLFAGLGLVGDYLSAGLSAGENLNVLMVIRLGIAAPLCTFLILMTFKVSSYRGVASIGLLAALLIGACQTAVCYFAGAQLAGTWYGLYVVIFFYTITMTGLNHISGTVASLSILGGYSYVVLQVHGMNIDSYYIQMMSLVAGITAAAITSYLIELQSRRHFASRQTLKGVTKSLQQREKHLFELYQYAPIAYVTLCVEEQKVGDHNLAFERLLGMEGQSVDDMLWSEFQLNNPTPGSDEDYFTPLMRGGVIVDVERVMLRLDSEMVNVLISAVPGTDEQGNTNEFRLSLMDISERKFAEQRFAALMDAAPDAILVSQHNGNLIVVNSRAEAVFGYPHGELLGTAIDNLLLEETLTAGDHHNGSQVNRQLQARRKDGRCFPAELSVSHIHNEQQTLQVTVIRDITRRRARENKLACSHRDLATQSQLNESLKQALTEAQLLADVCRILVEVNEKHMVWIAYDQNDEHQRVTPMARYGYEKGFLAESFFSCGELSEYHGPVGKAMHSGKPAMVVDTATDPDFRFWRDSALERGYGTMLAVPLTVKGDVFGVICVCAQQPGSIDEDNLTNLQKFADMVAHGIQSLRDKLAQRSTQRHLKETEEQGRLLLQSIDEGIFGLDLQGRVTFVNPAGAGLLGWRDYEMIGRSAHTLIHHTQVDGSHYLSDQCPMNNTCHHGDAHYIEDEVFWRQDGSSFAVAYASRPIIKAGELVGAVVSFRDISKLKAMTAELQLTMQRAEEATRIKADFLANMSHEIRTPMNAIIGLSHLALGTELTVKQQDYLNKISHSANNLLGLINDMLDFSKIEAGNLVMDKAAFSLDEAVLAGLLKQAVVKAAEKDLVLLLDIAPQIPDSLTGDAKLLRQILDNLINNALKFTLTGYIRLTVAIQQHSDSRLKLRFGIEDTGIGMDENQCQQLFQSFSQADTSPTRQYGGMGLGLSICKHLVDLMEGEIGVDSTPGSGSQFWFSAVFAHHQIDSFTRQSPADEDMQHLQERQELQQLQQRQGINSQQGLRQVGGNSGFYRLLLAHFKDSQTDVTIWIKKALTDKNTAVALLLVERLQKLSANIGAEPLSLKAQSLKEVIEQGKQTELLVQQTQSQLQSVISGLKVLDQQEQSTVAQPAVGPEVIKPLLQQLASCLSNDEAQAVEILYQLMPMLAGQPGETLFKQMGKKIEIYEFEDALLLLEQFERVAASSL